MDLGIGGRKALVCAASKGLGRGCAEALAQAGVDVMILARTRDDVQKAAEEIGARAGRTVAWLACDNARGAAQQIGGHGRCCEQDRDRQSHVETGRKERLQANRRRRLKNEIEKAQKDSRLDE
ncbi:MAG: SDR family NAD(P)-dependent oxidoreductase [Betaproteobacteria bacterium]|nr:MAG: SDR family NAD(P)-dependent oxidoreductase [Betaproteobacteria bacterium]